MNRWVQRFTPLVADVARPCRHAVGDRWQVDETYVKVAGRWRYVYRAIDQFGQVVDVFVSRQRDAAAAHRFFQRAIGAIKVNPVEVTTDQARLRPMRGLKQDRSAWVIIAGHAFVQNLRRGHYELAVDQPANRRVAVAFEELVLAI